MDYQATVEKLAHDIGARIQYTADPEQGGDEGPSSDPETHTVYAAPFTGSETSKCRAFWTTLHELGHVAHMHRSLQDPFFEMLFGSSPKEAEQEAEAWTWAFDHAGIPMNDLAKAVVQYSISSYLWATHDKPFIGPNLKRVFSEVGPNPAPRSILLNVVSRDPRDNEVKEMWEKYATTA